MSIARLASPAALADPAALEPVLGPVAEIARSRIETPGFSGSTHERLTVRLRSGAARRLVCKVTPLDADWTLVRSEDRAGREALLLAEPALRPVWEIFACPYLAYATGEGTVGLLMDDLTSSLLPDVREPLRDIEEERLLGALATLHARFWDSPLLDRPWLVQPRHLFSLIGPAATATVSPLEERHPVLARAREGWAAAFARLPPRAAALLRESPAVLAARSADLPRTLTHGDVKVANFAFLPDGRVAAFDWAFVGAVPVALELGWYLAVNASRLAGTKEQTIARYRRLLEGALGRALGDPFWRATETHAVLGGGAMLLWSKALALASGTPQARAEWDWWVDRIAAM